MKFRPARFLRRTAFALAAAYVVVSCAGCALVNAAMFHPPAPPYGTDLPGLALLGTPDAPVAAVWSPKPGAERAVLFNHGNAEDLRSVHGRLAAFNRLGFSALAYDYPGYGRTPGAPSEASVCAAAETAFRHLVEDRGFAPSNIVVCGYSIGSGPACHLAQKHPDVGGLLLVAPFKSAVRVVTGVRLLPIDPFPNLARIRQSRCPVLVLHGTNDRVVPFSHGRAVAAAAGGRARFLPVPGADHATVFGVLSARPFREAFAERFGASASSSTASTVPTASTAGILYVPGWFRSGADPSQEVALLESAFPGARCEVLSWDGDDLDFWACRDEADAEGRRFGALLAALPESERENLVLVGHSLGARIVVRTLAALAADGKRVRRAVLLAAALPERDPDLAAAARASREPLVCLASQGDAMLKWLYGAAGDKLEPALGLNGWPAPVPTNVVQRFLPPEHVDAFEPDAPLMDWCALRHLCQHYAPFYLSYLARLAAADWNLPDEPTPVRQGYPNLSLPTIDAEVWWTVEGRTASGWKLERNVVFGQWRILDADGWRVAWGDEEAMRRSFAELRE